LEAHGLLMLEGRASDALLDEATRRGIYVVDSTVTCDGPSVADVLMHLNDSIVHGPHVSFAEIADIIEKHL